MSNIVISPESGILEFNNNSPSGAAIRSATAPIRLDATGGNSFVTGGNFGIGITTPNSALLVHGHTIAISTTGMVGKGLHIGESYDSLGIWGSTDVGSHFNPESITVSAANRNTSNSAYIDLFTRYGSTSSSFGDIDLRAGSYPAGNMEGDVTLYTSGQNRLTVKHAGNVGIGSASPDHKLRVGDGNICIDSDHAYIGNIYRSFVASNTNIRLNNTTDMQFNLHNTAMDFKFGLQGSDPFFTIGGDGVVTSTGAHISGVSGIFSDATVTPKITTAAGNLNITPAGSYIFIGKGLYGSNVGVGYQNSAVSALKFFLGASIDNPDIKLERDGAGQLALRNGSNAQNLRIYNTYTSATNFERGSLRWENDVFTIAAEAGSAGGTSRNLSISGGATVGITTSDTERITVLANGLVGINDTSPTTYRLCVGGGIHATATSKFDGVITLNDVRVEDQIRHDGDTDTRIAFGDDAIQIFAGGVQMVNFSESTQDSVIINGGNVDVDFKVMPNGGGYEAFKVQASDGFVGIHKGAPTSQLDVAGTGKFSAGLFVSGVPVSTGSAAEADTLQTVTDRGSTTTTSVTIGDDLAVDTDTLFVDASTDRVGINRNSLTTYDLEVRNGAGGSSNLGVIGGSATSLVLNTTDTSIVTVPAAQMFLRATGGFYFQSGTTTKAIITKEGDVGIGTDNPSDDLHVHGTTNPAIRIQDSSNDVTLRMLADDSKGRIGTFSNHDFSLYSNSNERLVIDSAGNVGIGTDSPAELLTLKGDSKALAIYDGTDRLAAKLSVGGTEDGVLTLYERGSSKISLSANTSAVNFINPSNAKLGIGYGYNEVNAGAGSLQIAGDVGINTNSPQADFQVSGSGVFGIIGANSVNSTVTVAGYDDFGLDFRAHNTWTHWKARVGHGINFQLFNDGISNQNQVLELGKTTKDNAKVYVRSTGAFIEAGMNASASIPVVSMGCLPDSDHLGGAFLDVRDAVTRTHRYEFNRDGTFLASGIKIASTLTHDGDTDTLLEFTDNTIKLEAGGEEHIKLEVGGVTINEGGQPNDLRVEGDTDTHLLHVDGSSDRVGIGVANPTSYGMKLEVAGGVKIDDVNFFTNYTAGLAISPTTSADPQVIVAAQSAVQNNNNKTIFRVTDQTFNTPFFQVNGGGNVGMGTNVPTTKLDVRGNISGSGNFIGTGIGNRITASDGTPYLVSGDVAGEADTLQTVTDRGATSTNAINVSNQITSNEFIVGNQGVFRSNSTLGLQLQANSTDKPIIFLTNSGGMTERMRITRTGIGIETDSPDYRLDIGGIYPSTSNTMRLAQNNGGTAIRIGAGGGSSDVVLMRVDGNSTDGQHDGATDSAAYGFSLKYMGSRSANANSLSIFSDNQTASAIEAVTILQDGKVGIGSATANAELDVVGTGLFSSKVGIGTNSPTKDFQVVPSNGGFAFLGGGDVSARSVTNDTRKFTRIGTPHYHNSEEPMLLMVGDSNGSYNHITIGGGTSLGNAATAIKFHTAPNDATTNGTERMQINSAGNVGIGTDSPTQLLHLTDGSMRFDAEIMLRDNRDNTILTQSSSSTASNRTLQIGGTNDVTTYSRILFGQAQGGDLRVGIGTTQPSHALTVSGDVFLDGDAKHIFFGGTNTFVGESSNSQKLQLRGGGSTSVHTIAIDSQGRMGLGTPSPTERITITDGNIELVNSNTGVDLGTLNNADGKQSVALGYDNDALEIQSAALGYGNNATGSQSVALGSSNSAAVEGTAIGVGNSATASRGTAVGRSNSAAQESTAIGYNAQVAGIRSIGIGRNVTASAQASIAIGDTAKATGSNSIALGLSAEAGAYRSTAVGYNNTVDAVALQSSAFGYDNQVSKSNAGAFGFEVLTSGEKSFGLGYYTTIGVGNITELGQYDTDRTRSAAVRINGSSSTRVPVAMTMHSGTNAPSASSAADGYEDAFSLATNMYSIQRNAGDYVLYHNLGGSIVSTTLGGAEADTLQTVTDRGATTTNSITVGANLDVGSAIRHDGDTDTFISFSTNNLSLYAGNEQAINMDASSTTFNQDSLDRDFRVEGNNNQYALFVEGSTDRVGLGTGDPAHPLVVVAPGSTTDTNIDLTDVGGTSRLSMGYDSDGAFINGGDNGIGSSELHIRATNNSPIRVGAHNGLVSLEPGPYDGTNKYEFLSTSVKNYVRNGADGASYLNYNFTSLFADTNAIGGVEINPYYSGSERQGLTILANSATARVGIGTDSPASPLEVINDSSTYDGITLKDAGGGLTARIGAGDVNNNARMSLFNSAHQVAIQLHANTSNPTYFNAGKVGIGTDSPVEELHVDGNILIPQGKTLKGYYGNSIPFDIIGMDSSTDIHIYAPNNNSSDIFFDTHNGGVTGTRMTITNAGKVGIGTNNPQEKLNVSGNIRIDDGKQLKLFSSNNTYNGFIQKSGTYGAISLGQQTEIITDVFLTRTDDGGVQIGESSLYSHGRNAIWPIQSSKFAVYAGVQDDGGTGGAGFGFFNQGSAGKFLAMVPNVTDANNGGFKLQTMSSSSVVEAMFFKSDGSIGVGTDNPAQTFHIKGVGMIEDTSSTAYGTLQFGTNTSRYIRGNSAELQVGSTIQQIHFQNTSAAGQIASSAANGTDAIQILARTVHTSANILEVINGNGAAPIFHIDYTGNAEMVGDLTIKEPSPRLNLQDTTDDDDHQINFKNNLGSTVARISTAGDDLNLETVSSRDINLKPGGLGNAFTVASNGDVVVNTDTFFVDASNDNVGIGTASPQDVYDLNIYSAGTSSDSRGASLGLSTVNNNVTGSVIRLTEANYIGGYLQYDAYNNILNIGVHADNDTNVANDNKIISIPRDSKNVGIGTIDPNHNLEVTGSLRADSIVIGTDTVYEHSLNLNNEGTIRIGNAEMIDKVGNDLELHQGKLYIENGGDVGVGTSSPDGKLHVYEANAGSFTVDGTADTLVLESNGDGGMTIATAAASDGRIIFATPNDATEAEIKFSSSNALMTIGPTSPSDSLVLQAGNADKIVYVSGNGNVGIGSASPTTKLDVNGNIAITASLVHAGDTDTSVDFSTNTIALKTAGSQRVFVESDGQVGIGTNSVSNQLSVYGNASIGTSYYNSSAPTNGLIVEGNVGIGTASSNLKLSVEGTVKIKVYTYAALPAASTAGQRAFISDSYYTMGSNATFGGQAYPGGSNFAPVYSDGSTWRYG